MLYSAKLLVLLGLNSASIAQAATQQSYSDAACTESTGMDPSEYTALGDGCVGYPPGTGESFKVTCDVQGDLSSGTVIEYFRSEDCGGAPGSTTEGVDIAKEYAGLLTTECTKREGVEIYTKISAAFDGDFFPTCFNDDPAEAPDDPCFISSAMVVRPNGNVTRVDALKEGDAIVAATADGALTVDTVSVLSIAKPEARAAKYVELKTASDKTLTLTRGHHLPVGPACCSTLKVAKDVEVGETVYTVSGKGVVATTVTHKTEIGGQGLHSPVLTNGGFPVVDGVVTSFDSIDKVTLAKHGLSPLLAACKATGTCSTFVGMFLEHEFK